MFGIVKGTCLEHEGTGLANPYLDGVSISNQCSQVISNLLRGWVDHEIECLLEHRRVHLRDGVLNRCEPISNNDIGNGEQSVSIFWRRLLNDASADCFHINRGRCHALYKSGELIDVSPDIAMDGH